MGDTKDLTRMPDEVSRARGGPLLSSKGYKRGPHLYILALALSRTWASIPQETLTATFVKLGYYSMHAVAQFGLVTVTKVQDAMDVLEDEEPGGHRQKRLHPERDASGLTQGDVRKVKNDFEKLPTLSQEALLPQAKAQLAEDDEYANTLRGHGPRPWTELGRLASTVARMEPADVHVQIVPPDKSAGAWGAGHVGCKARCNQRCGAGLLPSSLYHTFWKEPSAQKETCKLCGPCAAVSVAPLEVQARQAEGRGT